MNHITRIILTAAIMAMATTVLAGNLTPPDVPAKGSGMATLADIYNQLDTGATTTPTGFQGPTSGPASASGKSLTDIMAKLPAADMTNGATAADVKAGKTFWGLRTDGTWGVQTGGYTCTGTMNGTRWYDNGNGTVLDMTTGLIWLKDASWGGKYTWGFTFGRAGILANGAALTGTPATLTDGSAAGDWRMPTIAELFALTTGTEAVLSGTPRAFSVVQSDFYWSSNIDSIYLTWAWGIYMDIGGYYSTTETDIKDPHHVWPVRAGQ
jgi:hypothetical protein